VYDRVRRFDENLIKVKKGEYWGVVNKGGKVIVTPAFDKLRRAARSGYFRVQKNKQWGMIDSTGKMVVAPEYKYVYYYGEGNVNIILAKKGRKWGAFTSEGKVLVPDDAERVNVLRGGVLAVRRDDDLWQLLNHEGKQILEPKYQSIRFFNKNVLMVKQQGKAGLVDFDGKQVLATEYEDIKVLYGDPNGMMMAKKGGKWGFVNKKGGLVTPIQYDDLGYFRRGVSLAKKNKKYGYIDAKGKVIIPFVYDKASDFTYEVAVVKKDNKWGTIDSTGKVMLPITIKADDLEVRVKYLLATQGQKKGLLDLQGKVLLPTQYNNIYPFYESRDKLFWQVNKDGLTGILDAQGKLLFMKKVQHVGWFLNKFFTLHNDNKNGLISETGKVIFPMGTLNIRQFSEAMDEQYFYVQDKKEGVILYDATGKKLLSSKFDTITDFSEGFAHIGKDDKLGLINRKAQIVVTPRFLSIAKFREGLARVGQ
jgi:hypothetical protein